MKKTILLVLLLVLAVHLISCKKSELKNSVVDNTATKSEKEMINTESSEDESKQNKIDFDWSKMNYNMLSSLIFDIQVNPEKYNNKRIKMSGNYHTSVYEGKRYYSVLIWDPTGCCPTGIDFIPPADMKYPEDFPEMDTVISVTCVFNYSEDDEMTYFFFPAEELVWENK